METLAAAELLAALGHESRLAIFRLLVEAGPTGVVASSLGERLTLPAATLSFHLAHLSRVKLIQSRREGRFIRYSAAYETMDELLAFLTHNCCQGESCLPKSAGCDGGNVRLPPSGESPHAELRHFESQPGAPEQTTLTSTFHSPLIAP